MNPEKSNIEKVRQCAERLAPKKPTAARVVEAAASSYRATWLAGQIDFVYFCFIAMGNSCPLPESARKLEACRCELRGLKYDLQAVGFPLQTITSLRQKHVLALVQLWSRSGLDARRVAWKCAALNVLLKALGKYPAVRAVSAGT